MDPKLVPPTRLSGLSAWPSPAASPTGYVPRENPRPDRTWTVTQVPDSGWVVLGSADPVRRIFTTRSEAIQYAHMQIMHARGGRIRIAQVEPRLSIGVRAR